MILDSGYGGSGTVSLTLRSGILREIVRRGLHADRVNAREMTERRTKKAPEGRLERVRNLYK